MRTTITRSTPIQRGPRTIQLEGMFDIAPADCSTMTWDVELPIEDKPWNIGLIVGPSGSGKTTLAREVWPGQESAHYDWPQDRPVVDGFPPDMGTKDIVALLSSVGFSSPPAWLRPFKVLSTGEQFRVNIARVLADGAPVSVVDEFTSVVDRTVAQIGSAAIANAVRKRDAQFVAVSCHYDIEDWLQPDWTYQPHVGAFSWRCLQPRPRITLDVVRVDSSAWHLFGPHHYLSDRLNKAATCFAGLWEGHPVVFLAVLPMMHRNYPRARRAHRLVTLPDYQGVGIGNRFCDFLAGVYKSIGLDFFVTTAHPARVSTLARNPLWHTNRQPSLNAKDGSDGKRGKHAMLAYNAGVVMHATNRLTAGFRYVGPAIDSPLIADIVKQTA